MQIDEDDMTPEERARKIIGQGGQLLLPFDAGDAQVTYSSRRKLMALIAVQIEEAVDCERLSYFMNERKVSVGQAREIIADAFAADPDFRRGYVDNVAMLLHDHHGIENYEARNKAGDEIVRLIFESQ